jgi:hypothetical protein
MSTGTVEERLTELEEKVARLQKAQREVSQPAPWWERHFGAFKESSYYEEAMRLGAEYRRAQPVSAP